MKVLLIGLTMVLVLFLDGLREKGRTCGGRRDNAPYPLRLEPGPVQGGDGKDDDSGALAALRLTFETFSENIPLLLNNVKFVMQRSAQLRHCLPPKATEDSRRGEAMSILPGIRRPDLEEERTGSIRFRLHGRFRSGG